MTEEQGALVYVVDDDADLGASVARMLRRVGYRAEPFVSATDLLASYGEAPAACIVTDIMMGTINGFAFADEVRAIDPTTAVVFVTAWPTTADAVDAIRRHDGIDYLEKPIDEDRLRQSVDDGVAWSLARRRKAERLSRLTRREREVFELLVRGLSSKAIAVELSLSPRTVEDHRAQIMAKTGANSLARLIALHIE